MKPVCLLFVLACCLLAAGAARAADPYEIHALLSLTGASAFGGQAILFNPQQHSQFLETIPCR